MSLADIDARMDQAVAAMDAGDYVTALRHARAAQGLMATTPDQRQGESSIAFSARADQIASFIKGVQAEANAQQIATGRRRSSVVYRNPNETGDWT
jgi:hypothetical protein